MLSGTTPLERLIPTLPTITTFDIVAVELNDVEILQVQYELASSQIETLLPPALHPTLPPLGQWVCWTVPASPWGEFRLVQFRISCRSGARPRGFLLRAIVDNAQVQKNLANSWGFAASLGEIKVFRGYDAANFQVFVKDRCVLNVKLSDPESLVTSAVQFFASMHGAETPRGMRLVQFDPNYETDRAERYAPKINLVDADTWGSERIDPVYPVVGWGAHTLIRLPRIRFVCRADVNAFQGTEAIQTG